MRTALMLGKNKKYASRELTWQKQQTIFLILAKYKLKNKCGDLRVKLTT